MEKDFVPYKQSFDLKEIGFDEFCFAIHDHGYLIPRITTLAKPKFKNSKMNIGMSVPSKTCTAPLYQQVFRWFRVIYGLHPYIVPYGDGKSWQVVNIGKSNINSTKVGYYDRLDWDTRHFFSNIKFSSYEAAELGALNKLIEIVKNNL